ncbi:MAG: ABC transporter permease, partial [Bryobacterales bacterium]|nr:ABC transporter permease [Bryobacterales bacterium]
MTWWRRREQELREELDAHLAMAVRDRIERGEDPKAAEAAARAEFGNRGLIEETTRDVWGARWAFDALQDLRYAMRGLVNQPLFTSVAVASLALGIGANLAVFTILYTVMLRTLPVREPGQLVELLQKYPGEPRGNGYWTRASYQHYSGSARSFSAMIGASWDNVARIDSSPEPVVAESVTPNYFSELGVRPALGRLIQEGDEGSAVLSDGFWAARYHRDPGILGRKILVGGKPVTVVGVADPSYRGLRVDAATSVWLPSKPDGGLALVARLKPGATLDQARAEMAALYRFTIEERLASGNDPLVKKLQVEVEPCGAGLARTRDYLGRPITVLMAASAALLLLACLNLAGMLTARGAARIREISLRLSLGASYGRLLRQFLTESLLLAMLGTVVGAGVAYASIVWMLRIFTSGRPHQQIRLDIQPDPALLLFALAIMVLTCVTFGLAPAWTALREVSRAAALRFRGRHGNSGRALIAVQVALSMALAVSAGAFSVHLRALRRADLGFQRDGVLLLTVDPSRSEYRGEKRVTAYRDLIERFRNEPGVESASLAAPTPLHGAGAGGWGSVEGITERPEDRRRISIAYAAPGYFSALKIPLLAGRDFSFGDLTNWRVAVINRTLAQYYFPNPIDAIGKRITMDKVTLAREPATYEIIGVVGDTNYGEIREDAYRGIYLASFRGGSVLGST